MAKCEHEIGKNNVEVTDGNIVGCLLVTSDGSVSYQNQVATRKEPEKMILDDVWGEIPRKQITAVMG